MATISGRFPGGGSANLSSVPKDYNLKLKSKNVMKIRDFKEGQYILFEPTDEYSKLGKDPPKTVFRILDDPYYGFMRLKVICTQIEFKPGNPIMCIDMNIISNKDSFYLKKEMFYKNKITLVDNLLNIVDEWSYISEEGLLIFKKVFSVPEIKDVAPVGILGILLGILAVSLVNNKLLKAIPEIKQVE